jgi:hemoglobin
MSADTTGTRSTTLYETLGGAAPLRLAVDQFYERVLGDPQLVHYFEGVDVPRVKRHQVLLLSQVLGGPAEYSGRALGAAHVGLDITGPDYDRVVEHLLATLGNLEVDPSVVHAVEAVVAGIRPDVVAGDPAR